MLTPQKQSSAVRYQVAFCVLPWQQTKGKKETQLRDVITLRSIELFFQDKDQMAAAFNY